MGVVSGCGCTEVYRFPHITYPYYSSCICSFPHTTTPLVFALVFFLLFLKCFSFLLRYFL